MLAIDTNVIVRAITCDDPVQAEIANRVVRNERVFVSLVALVETVWVLQSVWKRERQLLANDIAAFLALEMVDVELADWVYWALARYRSGADFADMLLMVAARDCSEFASFDRPLARLDLPGAPLPVRDLNS